METTTTTGTITQVFCPIKCVWCSYSNGSGCSLTVPCCSENVTCETGHRTITNIEKFNEIFGVSRGKAVYIDMPSYLKKWFDEPYTEPKGEEE